MNLHFTTLQYEDLTIYYISSIMSEFVEIPHDLTRFDKVLDAWQVQSFNEQGYVIVDDFLGEEWVNSLLEECKQLLANGDLKQHHFNFGEVKFEKPHVFEADLFDKTLRDKSVPLSHLYDTATPRLVSALDSLLPGLALDTGPTTSSIKLQFNNGGCFPYHYDNPGSPSRRQLTVIVYMNPSWEVGDGGEIVLWPFLEGSVTVAPRIDRAVIFRSDLVLHKVLPSLKDRFCFTIWIDGTSVNSSEDTLLTKDKLQFESFDAASTFFRSSPLQRVISRTVFADEYAESLLECVGGTPGEEPMLRHHQANVAALESKLMPLIAAFRERKNSIDPAHNTSIL
jgi:hypothetical protein